MSATIRSATEEEIAGLRKLFLEEFNNQFIYDKCHYYGWCDNYLFSIGDVIAGYGCIWGLNDRKERDTIFECYILPPFRKHIRSLFPLLLNIETVERIECQSNDRFLSNLLFQHAKNIFAEAILFEEYLQTTFTIEGVIFREKKETDAVIKEDDGPWFLEHNGEIVAHGGLMLNYNFPYADIYMHVHEQYRSKGYGALMVQELKKLAYNTGRIPAARCNINNFVSKATLEKAGLKPCGHILIGDVKI